MKIILVLPYLKIGGTETQTSYIAKHFKKKGWDVLVVIFDDSYRNKKFDDLEIKSLGLKFSWYNYPLILIKLFRTVKDFNPNYLISRSWNGNFFTGLVSLLLRKPYVLFLSGNMQGRAFNKMKRIIHGLILRKADKIISVSENARNNMLKAFHLVDKSNTFVVHNGIDTESVIQAGKKNEIVYEKDKINLVFVGTLIHRKGLDLILESINELDIDYQVKLKLYVIGNGPKLEEHKKYVKNNKLESIVNFELRQENPFKYLIGADIFVMASRAEGFPNVLVEAMAFSLPCIATDCETGPNEIIDGTNGSLVKIDDKSQYKKAILKYLKDEDLRRLHGKLALQTVKKRFQLKNQMSRIENIIKDEF